MMASKLGTRAAVLAAGLAVAGLTLSVSPANAAGDATQPRSQAPTERVNAGGMKFYDDFWTLGECQGVGDWGLANGKWTIYDCQASPWDWDLYVAS